MEHLFLFPFSPVIDPKLSKWTGVFITKVTWTCSACLSCKLLVAYHAVLLEILAVGGRQTDLI